MFELIETFQAFINKGDTTSAAHQLRSTQSTISKRLSQLSRELGIPLLYKDGKKLKLTAKGEEFSQKVLPLFYQIKEEIQKIKMDNHVGEIPLAISESIFMSLGQDLMGLLDSADFRLIPHLHRSITATNQLREHRVQAALIAGNPIDIPGVVWKKIGSEPLVLCGASPDQKSVAIWNIEPKSSTWSSVESSFQRKNRRAEKKLSILGSLENYSCLAVACKKPGNQGLVPLGVARTMGFTNHQWEHWPDSKQPLQRNIYMGYYQWLSNYLEPWVKKLKHIANKSFTDS